MELCWVSGTELIDLECPVDHKLHIQFGSETFLGKEGDVCPEPDAECCLDEESQRIQVSVNSASQSQKAVSAYL